MKPDQRIIQVAVVVVLAATFAPTPNALCASPTMERITTTGARPILEVRKALEQRYGLRITYEDPIYQGDELRTELARLIPNCRSATFLFAAPTDRPSPIDGASRMKLLLKQHQGSGNPGVFETSQNGDYIHLVPTAVRNARGELEPYRSLLDEKVTLPMEDRSLEDIVQLVLKKISDARGIAINLGTVPANMFGQERSTFGVSDVSARDLLARAFELANNQGVSRGLPPRRITWSLLYEATENSFYFNAHVIDDQAAAKINVRGFYATGAIE